MIRIDARRLVWDDLQFLLAVCRHHTVSAAAQQLCVDHATVSRRIARLEQALNAKLFEHQTGGYEPTAAGSRLRQISEDIEASIVACQAEISDQNLELEGVVRVGAPDDVGSHFLAPRLAAFCNVHRKLRINLITKPRILGLAQREIDIAIRHELPKEGRIVGRKLVDYDLGLYASRKYLAANKSVRSVNDLESHSLIGCLDNEMTSSLLDSLPFTLATISPRFQSSDILSQLQAVRDGHGIAVLPRFLAANSNDLVEVLARDVRLRRTFFLLLHEDNKKLARVKAVANYIHQQVNEEKSLFASTARPSAASEQPNRAVELRC